MLKVARKRLFTQLLKYALKSLPKGTFFKSLSCKRGGGAMFAVGSYLPQKNLRDL